QFENLKNNSIGKPLTRNAGFPQSGTMTYKGMHSGEFFERNSTATIKFDYYADVEMTVDFEAKKLSGKILNFSTNLEGFENPEGELTFGGNFRFDLGGDEIGFSMPVKEGSLTQGNRVAKFDAKSENKGRFFGKTGGLMWLRVSSTFKWTEGPDAGTTSATVGHVYSERQ
ncbi:MAG: transferrin-binding protein-like solute binding protein, partial [Bacteroidales bacterium]|nr:transferrin-binding protein-like solute binding protein [Bacteroidales bacterium]